MVTPLGYFDLIETFPKPGCAVCALLLRDVAHLLDSLLYERVIEANSHRAFRLGRGLCNEHGWGLTHAKGGAVGIAMLYQATVDEVLKIAEQSPLEASMTSGLARLLNANNDSGGSALADHLEPAGPCMACQLLADSEAGYIRILSERIADARLQEAYRASDGLCLPHFRRLLRQVRGLDDLQQLMAIQIAGWKKLKAELTEFIDKNDHRRAHETMGPEGDSGRRAIGQMAGEKGVFGVDPRPA